jgi:hypothetical protein
MLRYEITASYFVYLNPSSDYNYSFQTWSGDGSGSKSGFRVLTGSPDFDQINRVTGFFFYYFFSTRPGFSPGLVGSRIDPLDRAEFQNYNYN